MQVVLANRAISANGNGGGGFLPTTLEERNGQVPVFYSERVVLQEVDGVAFPFFFSKDDLDAAWQGGSEPGGENAAGASYYGRNATGRVLVEQYSQRQ